MTGKYRIYSRTTINGNKQYRLKYQVKVLWFTFWVWHCIGDTVIKNFVSEEEAKKVFMFLFKAEDKTPFTEYVEYQV